METECEECQERFKQLALKTLVYIREKKPEKFKLIQEKYNITNKDLNEALKDYE